jgi:Icc-related predicted phosphoesterase
MKILVIGDLHGVIPKIHFKEFDCIVCIGDICDDSGFRPFWEKYMKELEKNPATEMTIEDLIKKKLGKKGEKRLDKESLLVGNKILRFLDSFGKPIFMVPGNWDQSYGETRIKDMDKSNYNYFKSFLDFYLGDKINPKLTQGIKNLKDCQYALHEFSGVNFVGYGLSSAFEKPNLRRKKLYADVERKKLNQAYKKMNDKLKNAYMKRNKKLPTVFLTHNVPYGTKLDLMKKDSKHDGKHIGSTVAKEFCNKYQPLICIGGHMHEHFKKDKIKKTIAINAGFGKDANVLINIDTIKKRVKKIDFYSGYKFKSKK